MLAMSPQRETFTPDYDEWEPPDELLDLAPKMWQLKAGEK